MGMLRRKRRAATVQVESSQAAPAAGKGQAKVRGSGQVAMLRVLGLLFVAGGLAAIGAAYVGVAKLSCTDCQVPYMVSGGAGGIALVVAGAVLLMVAQLRSEGRRYAARMDRMVEAMGAFTEAVSSLSARLGSEDRGAEAAEPEPGGGNGRPTGLPRGPQARREARFPMFRRV